MGVIVRSGKPKSALILQVRLYVGFGLCVTVEENAQGPTVNCKRFDAHHIKLMPLKELSNGCEGEVAMMLVINGVELGTVDQITNIWELHHDDPFGLGGDRSADNIRLACKAHNLYMAEMDYGKDKMARYRRSAVVGAK